MPDSSATVSTNRAARRHPTRASVGRAYIGVAEAAEYLDLSEKTIRRLIDRGELVAFKFGRNVVRLKMSDLDGVFSVKAVGE